MYINGGSFSDNHATTTDVAEVANGGGVYNFGSMNITGVNFTGNQAQADGGGIYNADNQAMLVTASQFNKNSAGDRGGGIFSRGINFGEFGLMFSGNTPTGMDCNC
jgi:predicted outer membrane repeat protein